MLFTSHIDETREIHRLRTWLRRGNEPQEAYQEFNLAPAIIEDEITYAQETHNADAN